MAWLDSLFPTWWHVLGFLAVGWFVCWLVDRWLQYREELWDFLDEEPETTIVWPDVQAAAREAMAQTNAMPTAEQWDAARPAIETPDEIARRYTAEQQSWPEYKWRFPNEGKQ